MVRRPGHAADARQSAFLSVYRRYVDDVINPAEMQLKAMFDSWATPDHWIGFGDGEPLFSPSPIQSWATRPKRPESVLDKLTAKTASYPDGLSVRSLDTMHDLLGGRVVVYFKSDLALLDRAIRSDPRIELCIDDPPVAYLPRSLVQRLGLPFPDDFVTERASGYTSLHYVARFTEPLARKAPWFEIQVRTLAQHVWAEVEHLLGYKPEGHVPYYVERQLTLLANLTSIVDDEFELVRDELDSIVRNGDDIADDDVLDSATLPALIQEVGLRVSRNWVATLVSALASRGVTSAGKFRRLLKARSSASSTTTARSLRELVSDVYHDTLGRAPRDREVVTSLSNLADLLDVRGALTIDAVVGRIRAQIAYDKQWSDRSGPGT
jgi:putative GTP pyrophosphokinase